LKWALSAPKIRIAPSLLAADFGRLEDQVKRVEAAGAQVLHLDIMDGHFVPNISFGVPVIASLRSCTKLFFDAHLMIAEPARYAEAFVKAGCDHVTFHVETTDSPGEVVDLIHGLGVSAGVSLNPTTPADSIEAIIDKVEMVLVMSVWPGFGGQKFIAEVLDKVAELRNSLSPGQRLEIDGGIGLETIGSAVQAGADTLVAGSAIFGPPDPADAFVTLCQRAESTAREQPWAKTIG